MRDVLRRVRVGWPRSLRGRITLAAICALAVCGVVAGVLLLAAVERDGRRDVDRDLQARAAGIGHRPPPRGAFGHGGIGVPPPLRAGRGGGLPGGPDGPGGPGAPPNDEALLAGSGTFVQVADRSGQIVDQRGDVPDSAPGLPAEDGLRTVQIDGHPWRALTRTLGGGDLRVELFSTLQPVEDRVAHIRDLIVGFGLAALALAAVGAWLLTSLAVRPLARLRTGAARVSGASDLGTPLPEDEGPDEVRSLAHDLNEMLARLRASTDAMERALEATRRFAADAGHELRTPLTGLRATLDTLERNPDLPVEERQALLREVTAEQDRIVHLLEGLQALARGEAAEALPREDVELADLVDAAVFAARRRHPGVEFQLDDEIDGANVYGWPGGLRLVVDNLLDNAALHGRREGRVHVAL
ncbi:MAG TPA: HAMP domain-containing sensor histidine kinase, partial [Thermoleophilaceae bacterium]